MEKKIDAKSTYISVKNNSRPVDNILKNVCNLGFEPSNDATDTVRVQ